MLMRCDCLVSLFLWDPALGALSPQQCPHPLPRPPHPLQLWNFATATRLYEFGGWGCAVRCIAPSPALDVVGVGLEDG